MVHWLLIGGNDFTKDEGKIQWNNLNDYISNNNSKIEIYFKETGDIFERVVKLVCNQSYDDLDLDVNSMFTGSIKRVNSKPKNIVKTEKDINYFINY